MEEGFTLLQWCYYHRFNILNGLLALYIAIQLIHLIRDIRKDLKCHECIQSGKCSNNTGIRGGGNRISLLIKNSIINSRIVTRHSDRPGGRNGDSDL
ncbi:hypothetical protein VPH1254_0026 [Vibrio phage 1254]